jgi:hypothetical protein
MTTAFEIAFEADKKFIRRFVESAMQQLGRPYVWAGRGDFAVRNLQNVDVRTLGCDSLAFDCAGLVTWAAHKAGALDLRGWWGAQHLFDALPAAVPGEFSLSFYGRSPSEITHVGIDLTHEIILEAAGGDQRTLTYLDAIKQNALVRIGFERRADKMGTRSLSALRYLPLHPVAKRTPHPSPPESKL